MKEIFLLTVKNPNAQEKLVKTAFSDLHDALDKFREIYSKCAKSGYAGTDNSIISDKSYVKVAKLTTSNPTDTVRLRLENVTLVENNR